MYNIKSNRALVSEIRLDILCKELKQLQKEADREFRTFLRKHKKGLSRFVAISGVGLLLTYLHSKGWGYHFPYNG